jgi:putative thioredoxin
MFEQAAMTATATAKPAAASELIKDTTTQGFRQDVLAESMKQPILVDFWAPWCGPCKQLGPLIEKVVKAAGGKVKLVKMNIDEHPQIAGQLGVKSIPAVFAFDRGQPVDGFVGNLAESQVKSFIERLAGGIGPSPIEEMLAAAEVALAEGDTTQAAEMFTGVLAEEDTNAKALGGLIKVYVQMDMLEQARQMLAAVKPGMESDPAITSAKAAVETAEAAASVGDTQGLLTKLEADPNDHHARLELAIALNGKGEREEATDHLITIIHKERKWNDDAARKQLVQFFEAWGTGDDATVDARRKLSAVLFS